MNELFDQISADIKTAMLAREKVTLEALRGIKKEFLEAKTAKGSDGNLSEASVIERYLPDQMSDADLEAAVAAIIAQVGANGPQDMGKVMGVATKQLAGKTEGRLISEKVKALLNK